jgi:hypothetical protein
MKNEMKWKVKRWSARRSKNASKKEAYWCVSLHFTGKNKKG